MACRMADFRRGWGPGCSWRWCGVHFGGSAATTGTSAPRRGCPACRCRTSACHWRSRAPSTSRDRLRRSGLPNTTPLGKPSPGHRDEARARLRGRGGTGVPARAQRAPGGFHSRSRFQAIDDAQRFAGSMLRSGDENAAISSLVYFVCRRRVEASNGESENSAIMEAVNAWRNRLPEAERPTQAGKIRGRAPYRSPTARLDSRGRAGGRPRSSPPARRRDWRQFPQLW